MLKVSVVTITYNAEASLPRTLDSVLAQSYPNMEHIVVDGASADATVRLANAYKERSEAAANGHEVRILSEPDGGLYDAMNKGLRLATGDYVVFMNAGDSFATPGTVAHVASKAEEGSDGVLPAVVYGDTDLVDDGGHFVGRRRLAPPERLTWRSFRHGMLVCHQSFYARTDIAKRTPYDLRYRYSADVDWCIRIMKEAEKMGLPLLNAQETLTSYALEGESTRHHRASLMERFRVMCRHYGLLSTLLMHAWFVVRKKR